jgi:hypothetical protein
LSTVLAHCPGSDRFENGLTAAQADEESSYELEIGSISNLAIGRLLADSAEDFAVEAMHGSGIYGEVESRERTRNVPVKLML